MCKPIALILTEDTILTPPRDAWNHSHEAMFKAAGIPPSKSGEKYALVEVRSPDDRWRDPVTNAVLPVTDDWPVTFNGDREPKWWTADKPAQEARARDAARRWIAAFPENIVPYAKVSGGDRAKVSGGYGAKVSGGYGATVSGGDYATVSGGDYAKVSGGDYATVSGGVGATVSGGYGATVSGEDGATVSGGDRATVSGGDYATVSGGDCATVSGGDCATVSGGVGATVSGGYGGAISASYWDKKASRRRIVIGHVGEDGILPNTPYKVVDGKLIAALEAAQPKEQAS